MALDSGDRDKVQGAVLALPLPRLRGRNARAARRDGASRQRISKRRPLPALPRKRGRERGQRACGRPAYGSVANLSRPADRRVRRSNVRTSRPPATSSTTAMRSPATVVLTTLAPLGRSAVTSGGVVLPSVRKRR